MLIEYFVQFCAAVRKSGPRTQNLCLSQVVKLVDRHCAGHSQVQFYFLTILFPARREPRCRAMPVGELGAPASAAPSWAAAVTAAKAATWKAGAVAGAKLAAVHATGAAAAAAVAAAVPVVLATAAGALSARGDACGQHASRFQLTGLFLHRLSFLLFAVLLSPGASSSA